MKKKIFSGVLALVLAAIAAFNVNLNLNPKKEMSLLALANVEALAQENIEPYKGTSAKCEGTTSVESYKTTEPGWEYNASVNAWFLNEKKLELSLQAMKKLRLLLNLIGTVVSKEGPLHVPHTSVLT